MIELGEVEVDVEVLISRSGVKILVTGARHKVGVGVEYVRSCAEVLLGAHHSRKGCW
jgi:hypothetical protein